MSEFKNVTVVKKANVYFDGKVTSRTVLFPDGSKKTLGIMQPGEYEFSTGKADLIEEERRLLYVAMTRARQSLQLIAPLKYHVTQQRRDGDRHVYGARSRFMTDRLMCTMMARFYGRTETVSARLVPVSNRQIDVAGRMREMW